MADKKKDKTGVPPTDLGDQKNPPGATEIVTGEIVIHTNISLNLRGDPFLLKKVVDHYETMTDLAAEANKRRAEHEKRRERDTREVQ